jgi:transcriptional regulator with XRE-family HTH domain
VCTLSRGLEEPDVAPKVLAEGSLGERLSMLRKARRLSLVDLGSSIGVSHVTIWNWEHGRGHPDKQKLQSLAHHLHASVQFLADGEGSHIIDLDAHRQSQVERAIIVARQLIAKAAGTPVDSIRIDVDHRRFSLDD